MISRLSLSLQILIFALLNVLLLALVFLVFARTQFRFNLSSFLLQPAKDRVVSASRLAALELPETPRKDWNQLLARYSAIYPAEFYLFDESGVELAGPLVTLPHEFAEAIKRNPGGRVFRTFGGPPREMQDPPPPGDFGPRPDSMIGPGPPDPRDEPATKAIEIQPGHRFRSHFGPTSQFMELMKTGGPVQYWIGVHIPIWIAPGREPMHSTLVWRISSLWTQKFFFDYRPWLLVVLAVIGISIVCWLPLIRGVLRAISQLTEATRQIADGHFEVKLPRNRRDELGRLSESIGRMAKRLSGLVQGQRRFLSDIAHELCSPIARIQVATGILEQRAEENQAEYVSAVQEEAEHMSSLVNELLAFSKSQGNTQLASLCSVNVAGTVGRVLDREGSEAATLVAHVDESIHVLANPDYLFRSIANVVRNAIRYAGASGPIDIRASKTDEAVVISVLDCGPGIPEDEIDNIFRPFYRPELARQRETGGVGLGLAIVRSCVEACGGSVSCRNRTPTGLAVEIHLRSVAKSSATLELQSHSAPGSVAK